MAVDLSVAIIFKNEIRCIERCLKSLQPLREYLSVQIVMADTGSTDGSRAVAERYADVLFDFPWINDFSAARNAVLERCTGDWALIMDCDEWLKADRAELKKILKGKALLDGAQLRNRSYATSDFEAYTDVYQLRLLRMAAKPHYTGAIHEQVNFSSGTGHGVQLVNSMLHHDGYVMLNDGSEMGKAKRARNIRILRAEVAKAPDSLRRILELLDAADMEPDYLDLLRDAVARIEKHSPEWEKYGPSILHKAVQEAHRHSLQEWEKWVQTAWQLFPKSWYTRIDVNHFQMTWAYTRGNYEETVRAGEQYLSACQALRLDLASMDDEMIAPLLWSSVAALEDSRVILSNAYLLLGVPDQAVNLLRQIDWQNITEGALANTLELLSQLYSFSEQHVSEITVALWCAVCDESRDTERMRRRKEAFLRYGKTYLSTAQMPQETGEAPVWSFLLSLRGKCILGDYAAVMAAQTPEEADAALAAIEDLTALPPAVFVHALKTGAAFPLPGRELTVEQSDAMAAMLAEDRPFLREAALFAAEAFETTADLIWARSLALTAFKANDWAADEEAMALLRSFVKVESVFLPLCYAETALRAPALLPPMQRFALHLTSAFAVLFPDAVSPSFPPTGERSVHGALAELKLAAVAAPQQKAAINAFLDTLSTT